MYYQVQFDVPYEGIYIEEYATLEEVKDCIKKTHNWADVNVVQVTQDIDLYELMKEVT
jgi:hypothetical protein